MRRWLAPVLVVPLLATGCTFSHVDPKASVHISGRAVDATGAPLAHATVRLFKEADLGEAIVGVVLAIGSLGTVCLLPDAPAVCNQAHVTTTDADGNYAFDLKGSDTQGLIGNESTLDLVVAAPGSSGTAASTSISFTAAKTTVALPDAQLWDASPKLSEKAGKIDLSWSALPASHGTSPTYSTQFFNPAHQAATWTQSATGTHAETDARILEDQPATAAVGARADLTGTGTGSVRGNYLSSRLSVKATAGPAPSRHDHCYAVTGTASLGKVAQNTCGATDGNLYSPARLTAPAPAVVTGATIDLGRVRPVSLIVARGLAGMTVIEVSTDGITFHQVGIGTDTSTALSPPGHPMARYVRVRAPSGLDESLLSEISVW